mmetsp:Transcript_125271/g.400431  ORF Transcript_125271/g.400431 Transcript_125271/m.400431 type:complete len:293 (-) Transcript_125271:886-1764(-)
MARERNEMRMATMSTSATEFALSFPSRSESSASSKFRSSRCSIIIRSSRHLPTADWEQELGQLFSGEPYSEASTYNPQIVIPSIARKHCRCHCHRCRRHARAQCVRSQALLRQGSGPRSICFSKLPPKGPGGAAHAAGKRIPGCSGTPAGGGPGLRRSASGSCVEVRGGVDLGRHLANVDFEPLLDLLQDLSVLVGADEGQGQTLGAEAAGTTDTVEVRVAVRRHVVIDHNVDPLDVDATAEQVGGDHDSLLELLELLVARNAVFLAQTRVDGDRREVALDQELVEGGCALH